MEELLLELVNTFKSVEIRKNLWMDGDEQKLEYVSVGRIRDSGFSRASGSTIEKSLERLKAKGA